MAGFRIVTNNPAVDRKYPNLADFRQEDVAGIFRVVRDAIHQGAALISHPLAGSIKPNESPYKSIMLSLRTGAVDERSLTIMEDAIAVLRKLPVKTLTHAVRMLDDFAAIDLDLMDSAMAALPPEYYENKGSL